MKRLAIRVLVMTVMVLHTVPAMAGKPSGIADGGSSAVVTFLSGKAYVVKPGATRPMGLKQGDALAAGDCVRTEKKSRLEIRLPDGSIIRIAEGTDAVIETMTFDTASHDRDVNIRLKLGKIWSTIARSLRKKDRFNVSTQTVIAGVRGTVFRMNSAKDKSALVKVYDGEVTVKRRGRTAGYQDRKIKKPKKIAGPTPVPGPHAVSMDQWTYIIRSMQKITVRPDGTSSGPEPFDRSKDLDDWVKWNLNRDKKSTSEK